jgi:HSP20 family protein
MSIVRYDPWGVLNRLQREIDRAYDTQLPDAQDESTSSVARWSPAVDIKEEDDRYVLVADLPGVESKDIEITQENGVLTIRGERSFEDEEHRDNYRRVERVYGSFYRRFTLPDVADTEGISAKSRNGVLEVVIPKHAKVMPRKISVEG